MVPSAFHLDFLSLVLPSTEKGSKTEFAWTVGGRYVIGATSMLVQLDFSGCMAKPFSVTKSRPTRSLTWTDGFALHVALKLAECRDFALSFTFSGVVPFSPILA